MRHERPRRRLKSRSRSRHWHGGNERTEFGKEYFESNYRNYEAQCSSRKLEHYLSQITIRASGCDRVLDIGCGLGNWAGFVATQRPEWDVTAVDVDADIIDHNRRRSPNVRFQVSEQIASQVMEALTWLSRWTFLNMYLTSVRR